MLADIKGEKAIFALADLLDPIGTIFSDKEIVKAIQSKELTKMEKVQIVLRSYPKEIIKIMAISDGEDVENYEVNALTLPFKLLALLNEPEIADLFTLRGQPMKGNASTGSASGNIEAK